MHGKLKGKYSIRVGDYRVIYVIDERNKEVIFLCIGHRGKVYKRAELIKAKIK